MRLMFLLFVLVVSCGKDSLRPISPPPSNTDCEETVDIPVESELPSTCQTGGVMGWLCPDGSLPLANALVVVTALDCSGQSQGFSTQTTDEGYFAIAGLPAGTHTVQVIQEDQSWIFQVTVISGEIVSVGSESLAPLCTVPSEPRLAVIKGEYDSVQTILGDIGLGYDLYEATGNPSPATQFLTDLPTMLTYDVIFFNCGRMERDFFATTISYTTPGNPQTRVISFDYDDLVYENLRTYVASGGNVYASDWAWPIAEGLNPDSIDFRGDETNAMNVNIGLEADVDATLVSADLQLYLGTSNLVIDFNLQGYSVIDETQEPVLVSGDVPVFVQGSSDREILSDRPLLVGYRPFTDGGMVLYTTFHYHSQSDEQATNLLRYLIFQL